MSYAFQTALDDDYLAYVDRDYDIFHQLRGSVVGDKTTMNDGHQIGGWPEETQLFMSPSLMAEDALDFMSPGEGPGYELPFQSPASAQLHQTLYAPNPTVVQPITLPDPVVRSTTPEMPFTARLSSSNAQGVYVVPGGFASKLADALVVPSTIAPAERQNRQRAMLSILAPDVAHPLPPPSPTIKTLVLPDTDVENAHRVRQEPAKITIAPLAPKLRLDPYQPVTSLPEGPAKEAAKSHNNSIAQAKSENDKTRNNTAAARSRDRKKRAIVHRAEAMSNLRTELRFWKARAVGLGAGVRDWELLDGNVRREMVADRRFDAFDFSNDATEDERIAELEERLSKASSSPGKKKAQRKRKAEEVEE